MPVRPLAVLRLLVLFSVVALFLAALTIGSARAGPAPGDPQHCQSLASANAEIDAAIARVGGSRETLTGKEAESYLAVVNIEPPATDIHSDLVVLFERPTDTVIGVKLGEDKVCIVARVGAKTHAKAIEAAKGHDT